MKRTLSLLMMLTLLLVVAATLAPATAEELDIASLTKAKDINEEWDDSAIQVALNGDTVSADNPGVSWDATMRRLAFDREGDYLLSGTLNGTLYVYVTKEEDVRLILNGVSVTSPEGPALHVRSADKVILTLAPDTVNTFTDTTSITDDGDEISSCVYSEDDMSINGSGAMVVTSNVKNGLVCKNDLLLVNGDISVTASGNGVRGKDSVTLLGGSLNVVSGGDAVESNETDDEQDGRILIAGGSLTAVSGGGAGNAETHERHWGYESVTEDSVSMKGVKATNAITIAGGTLALDCADDALHAKNITITGGEMVLATGDDGAHADEKLAISGGKLAVSQSYEGLEATDIAISGGEITIVASDDGVNAAGGSDDTGAQGFGGFDRFGGADDSALVAISGGVIRVNAEGDGIDSNGDLTISGGELYVSGPTNFGNGALDYGGSCLVTGGVLAAVDAGGMSQNASADSTQPVLMASGESGEIVMTDAEGNELIRFTPDKSYGTVIVSSPGMYVGSEYTLTCGGTTVFDGELEQVVTGGSGGFGGGFGGGRGGHGGRGDPAEPPEGGVPPQDGGVAPDGERRQRP